MTPEERSLVIEVVRDAVREFIAKSPAPGHASGPGGGPGALGAGAAEVNGRVRVETVRIASDADLDAFARYLLGLYENPKSRQDVRAGRIRFRSAPRHGDATASAIPVRRVEQGAVTERHVRAAADAGERIVAGRAAVVTPLARDRARALGISIERERS